MKRKKNVNLSSDIEVQPTVFTHRVHVEIGSKRGIKDDF